LPAELDEVLDYLRNHPSTDDLGATIQATTKRWEEERFLPLLRAYEEHLRSGSKSQRLPTLTKIEAHDPLVERLLSLDNYGPDAVLLLLQRWEQESVTNRVRAAGLWDNLKDELLADKGFWRRSMIEHQRSSYTEEQLQTQLAFYESSAGRKQRTVGELFKQEIDKAMKDESLPAKINELIEKFIE
jgi:hypothetical protein